MAESSPSTDKGVGLALLCGALATLGAGLMLVGPGDGRLAGTGFAVAVTFATIAVVAVHLYPPE